MTNQRDSVTAAELDEYLRQVEEMWWEDYEPIQKMLGFLAALRRELGEARTARAIDVAEHERYRVRAEALIADIAKKDAALREIEYLDRPQVRGQPRRKTIQQIALDALAPAAQGETHDTPLLQKIRTTPSMYREVAYAPAPCAGETVLIEQVFAEFEKRTKAVPLGHENASRGASTYNWRQSILAELRDIAAAPTTGEPVDHRPDNSGLDDGPWLPGHEPRKKAAPKSPEEMAAIRAKAWATRCAAPTTGEP